MNHHQPLEKSDKPDRTGWLFILLGLLMLWIASLAFVLEVINIVTGTQYPVGEDPSFNILVAVFFLLLAVLGGLLIWRGWQARNPRASDRVSRYVNIATTLNVLALGLVFCSGGIVLGANNYYKSQYGTPVVHAAPQPDYTLPVFPTPASLQPTPTYDATQKYLAGNITRSLDHLRVGDIWISASPDAGSIHAIEITLQPVECSVPQSGTFTSFALAASQTQISGPLSVEGGSFFASQDTAVIHGVMMSADEAMGTISLHYIDSASGKTCDLGTFEYDAFTVEGAKGP